MKNKKPHFGENALNGIESLLVVLVFWGAYNLLDLKWAIGLATAGSLWIAYSRWRRGLAVGKFLPLITVLIVARGIAGILTDNEDVYFGFGIAQGAAFGVVMILSVPLKRNLLAMAAPYIFDFPPKVQHHPIYRKTLGRLAYVAGIYFILKAGFDLWLFQMSSVNEYIIIRTIVSYPLGLAVFWSCVAYGVRKFSQIPDWEGFLVMLDRQTYIYKEALSIRFQRISFFKVSFKTKATEKEEE